MLLQLTKQYLHSCLITYNAGLKMSEKSPRNMLNFTEIKPPRYPTNLIDKDWSQRYIKFFSHRLEFIKKVHDLQVFEDDVWLVTLPKCGTTWMQELLWLVMNDFDFETAKKEHLEVRTPFLE